MTIDIITPSEKLFSGSAKQINLPGSDGSFEILENHAPIVATLAAGNVVIVDDQNQQQTFEITGGVVEQSANKVIVLVE
ncbi:MAG: ATP synthase F1 subunit epsilon [Bacteroidales bacterium]|jgi:F-type H+-transporting ATPase subunit epsilon|nr:ATP synthase F1 subunit epsilon [Bacteroidales bacterium]MBO7054525.1 ATP synthase F1 subunit epsilon [Bacteroidales bacterium]